MIAAGLEGISPRRDPGKRLDINMYARPHREECAETAAQPAGRVARLRRDKELKSALGNEFSEAYLRLKHQEWNSYAAHFTQWERDVTLDI